ncbi:kinase-like domain-containing protein [Rhizophagus clarus]|uniref:Kinase-like domain-containing protein n=1 Tax=Rhizophagus clarus TaxID=94130 RepID=A0A8H3QX21_9GLOM|nr:kinase-like domain-containing protein [Rhizophagus clarus]
MNSLEWFGMHCSVCGKKKTGFNWCRTCSAKHFQQNFRNWTSGNKDIDEFIQDAQLSAEGGFGKVFKAKWTDGLIRKLNDEKQDWERLRANDFVALKCLNDSKDVSLEFIHEITCHRKLNSGSIIKLYGITREPETKNYMMVLEYAENGSLRHYLSQNNLNWEKKIRNIHYIALGLDEIHQKGLIHRDLHTGNILMNETNTCITDMGLCRPVNHDALDKTANYGVLPYMAPEILRRKKYTEASDIYSFGIVMYEIISGLPPYYDISHNENLAISICEGLRPNFNIEVPKLIVDLISECLDANPSDRPTAEDIKSILCTWWKEIDDNLNNPSIQGELIRQIRKAEKINNDNFSNLSTSGKATNSCSNLSTPPKYLSGRTHSEAIYVSRPFSFNNLPESKNSDRQYDTADSMEGCRINVGNSNTGQEIC